MTTLVPAITVDQFRDAIGAAVRAPSIYNAQPWRFTLRDGIIEVRIDPYRLLPIADPDRWGARIACGAATANIRLALAVAGIRTEIHLACDTKDDLLVALVSPVGRHTPSPRERALHTAIPVRHSNRRPFFNAAVPVSARARLIDAADLAGASLMLTDDRLAVTGIADIVRAADARLRGNAAYRVEMQTWIAHHRVERAGISPDEAGVAPAGSDVLPMRDFEGPERRPGRDYETDPLIGVLSHSGTTRDADVAAGLALQMVLLTATDERLATSLLSQPIEVPEFREQLSRVTGHQSSPRMVIRIGFGQPGGVSPRRSVDSVTDLAS